MGRSNPFEQKNDGGWCECSECSRTFGGLSGFDRHRISVEWPEYDWQCATDVELADRGLVQDGRGWWVRQDGYSALRGDTQTVPAAENG